jgi:hypothetical protein
MSLTDMFVSDKDTETHRVCGTCGELRPVEDFYKDGKDNHGNIKYRRDCKECYKVTRIRESEMKRRKTK